MNEDLPVTQFYKFLRVGYREGRTAIQRRKNQKLLTKIKVQQKRVKNYKSKSYWEITKALEKFERKNCNNSSYKEGKNMIWSVFNQLHDITIDENIPISAFSSIFLYISTFSFFNIFTLLFIAVYISLMIFFLQAGPAKRPLSSFQQHRLMLDRGKLYLQTETQEPTSWVDPIGTDWAQFTLSTSQWEMQGSGG